VSQTRGRSPRMPPLSGLNNVKVLPSASAPHVRLLSWIPV
jgi:hypothetical protein